MSKEVIRFFYWFATLCFIASLVAHMSLYLGLNPQIAFPRAWLFLQLSIIVSFVGLFLAIRSAPTDRAVYKTPATGATMLLSILFVLFLFYALFNVFHTSLLMNWGYLTLYQGQPAIFNKATLWKIPTPQELPVYQRYAARRSSGHWMPCHLLAALILSIELNLKLVKGNLTTHSTGAE